MDKFFTLDFGEKVGNKIDKERLIREAYPRAEALLKKYSIKEEGFRNIYGSMVDEDKKEVLGMKQSFSKDMDEKSLENNKLSEIFNSIALEQFEKNNWMGEEAFTTGTSEYDKLKTGISNITEFHDEKGVSYMAMAVKVTFSSSLNKKLLKIKDNIKSGELSKIKYFESELHRGELKKVPSVIVGCEKDMLLDVVELWLQKNNKALEKHPLQFLILDQIEEEIKFFKKEASFSSNRELIKVYENIEKRIDGILQQKKTIREELESPKEGDSLSFKENHDNVMSSLKVELESIFGD